MDIKELHGKVKEKLIAAKALLESDSEKAKEMFAEAKGLKDKYDQLVEAEELERSIKSDLDSLNEGVFPANLPASDEASDKVSSSTKQLVNPVHVLRFGDMSDGVKQVAKELYGDNYYGLLHQQTTNFVKYARSGGKYLTATEEKSLKTVILDPNGIEVALKEGQNTNYLKDTMVESIGELGGFAVPPQISNRIIRRLTEPQNIRSRANVVPTSRLEYEYLSITGGDDRYAGPVRVYPVRETPDSTPQTNITLGRTKIPVHLIKARADVSKNQLEDQATNLVTELTRQFGEALAIAETDWFLTGNGTNIPKGLIIDGTTLRSEIASVNSGAASALTWDGLISLKHTIKGRYRTRAGTMWLMESDTVAAIKKLRATAGGDYLWNPFQYTGGSGDVVQDVLMSHTVVEQEIMPSVAAGTYPIIFGDWSGYTIVDHVGGMSIQRYDDSSTDETNTVRFVLRRRFGGDLTEPWKFAAQIISS